MTKEGKKYNQNDLDTKILAERLDIFMKQQERILQIITDIEHKLDKDYATKKELENGLNRVEENYKKDVEILDGRISFLEKDRNKWIGIILTIVITAMLGGYFYVNN
jgi:hypothetical protein